MLGEAPHAPPETERKLALQVQVSAGLLRAFLYFALAVPGPRGAFRFDAGSDNSPPNLNARNSEASIDRLQS